MVHQLQEKQRELLELQQRKIELELIVTKKKIAESEKEIRGVVSLLTGTLLNCATKFCVILERLKFKISTNFIKLFGQSFQSDVI